MSAPSRAAATGLRNLSDRELATRLEEIERAVATLKFSRTAIGARLLLQYEERLDDLRDEIHRRRT